MINNAFNSEFSLFASALLTKNITRQDAPIIADATIVTKDSDFNKSILNLFNHYGKFAFGESMPTQIEFINDQVKIDNVIKKAREFEAYATLYKSLHDKKSNPEYERIFKAQLNNDNLYNFITHSEFKTLLPDNNHDNEKMIQKGNSIAFIRNGEGSMGFSIYKAEDFIATSDISVGYSEKLNREIGLFITTVADRIRGKYNFGYKRSDTRLKKEKLKLPIDEKGQPDYVYMENFIKKIEFEKLTKYIERKTTNA